MTSCWIGNYKKTDLQHYQSGFHRKLECLSQQQCSRPRQKLQLSGFLFRFFQNQHSSQHCCNMLKNLGGSKDRERTVFWSRSTALMHGWDTGDRWWLFLGDLKDDNEEEEISWRWQHRNGEWRRGIEGATGISVSCFLQFSMDWLALWIVC